MKWPLVLVVAAILLCGCRSQARPAVDPFFGRTRVDPPGTGTISRGSVDPYFRGTPSPMTSTPSSNSRSPTPAGSPPAAVLASREPVIRVLQPRPKAAAPPQTGVPVATVNAAPREPRRLSVPSEAIDILDLPPAPGSSPQSRPSAQTGRGGFRLASAGVPTPASRDEKSPSQAVAANGPSSSGSSGAKAFAPRSDYGHDGDYRWLRGRLEYSQIDRRWKLRYIPIDGETDRYGGSVILGDASLLSGCERGDFIEVHGQPGGEEPKKGFAPLYHATEVKRL